MVIERSKWDSATNSLVGRYNKDIERKLRDIIIATEDRIEDLKKKGVNVLDDVFKDDVPTVSFTKFFEEFANTCELDGIESGTKRNYIKVYNWWNTIVGDVSFEDVNLIVLSTFKKKLLAEGLHVNSIADYLKNVRAVWNRGRKRDLTEKNFPTNTDIGIKKKATERLFLEKNELATLFDLYEKEELDARLHRVLEYFLFACYTGLRYSDVQAFSKRLHVSEGYIRIMIAKTDDYIPIPLNAKSRFLLDKIDDKFNTINNQDTNEHLRDIMLWARINKKITFHSARHTFATVALTLGVDLKTVSKLLGHATVRTTEIYAKIVDEKLVNAMSKFDDL